MDFSESDNFNAKEIAEEAEHLTLVLAQIREQIELLENDGFSYRVVDIYDENDVEEYRTDKFRHDARARDIRILKNALSTPYFARMRLCPIGISERDDTPSMTKARRLITDDAFDGDTDIYVGANVIVYKDKIIVYSHNSPLGNRVYDRFENGIIECEGYTYRVIFRRKFDIRGGKLIACFCDYSEEKGGIVYDKFLAHMLEVKRADKRLTDIIPTIQANQNAIITRPADENCVVTGCAGCGKTMILLQRLEYLGFNRKLDLDKAVIVAPSARYTEHIRPVVDDLMIGAARRLTMSELYRELILSLRGIKQTERKKLADLKPAGDEGISDDAAIALYGDDIKRKLILALSSVKKTYVKRMQEYRAALARYEERAAWDADEAKPIRPVVAVDLDRFPFIADLGAPRQSKARMYLLLTAYAFILGKPEFDGALFIDEGQDYFKNEYRLLAELTTATVNVYGDVNQQIVAGRGIDDLGFIGKLWDAHYYALNENYRNAREITAYVNDLLGMNVTSLGLDGGTVRTLPLAELEAELAGAEKDGDRVAVIYSANDSRTARFLKRFVPKRMLYTVVQAKGMEYERVYACGKFSDTQKYVAYTRALAELVICN